MLGLALVFRVPLVRDKRDVGIRRVLLCATGQRGRRDSHWIPGFGLPPVSVCCSCIA